MNENGVYIAIIGLLRIEFSALNTILLLAKKIRNKCIKKLTSEITKIDLSIIFFEESLMKKLNILFFKIVLHKNQFAKLCKKKQINILVEIYDWVQHDFSSSHLQNLIL